MKYAKYFYLLPLMLIFSVPAHAQLVANATSIDGLDDDSGFGRRTICNAACAFYSNPGQPDHGQWVYVSIDNNETPGIWTQFHNPNRNFTPRPASQQACRVAAQNACQYFDLYPQFGTCDVIRLYRTTQDRWGRPNALLHPAVVRCP